MNESNSIVASVVIPAWNGERFLANCLDSLRRYTSLTYEVIVVDNGSQDGTVQVAEQYAEVLLLRNPVNMGFAHAVNQGMRAAQGEIIFLLNQDTLALSDWLAPLANRIRQDEQVGILGCKLLYPDGQVQHAGARLLEPVWMSEHLTQDEASSKIDYVTGAAMAIRRVCFEMVGEFDEDFSPAYFEDVDYCLRAQVLGWQVVYEPQAVWTHFESQSRGDDDINFLITVNAQRLRLVLKHHDASWLREVFLPAEREYVARNLSCDWLLAMANAYLRAACSVGGIARWRADFYADASDGAAEIMLGVLFELRATAVAHAFKLLSGG